MRTLALAFSALLLLTSCSDDPQPIEPTATPSPKPTATAPAFPSEAKQETPDGSIAFVSHWIDVFNFSVSTGDLTSFNELNGPACEGCDIYEDLVAEANGGASEVRGFRWSPGRAHLSKERQLEVAVKAKPYEIRDSKSSEWSKVRGDTYRLGFDLEWAKGRWQVGELYQPREAE